MGIRTHRVNVDLLSTVTSLIFLCFLVRKGKECSAAAAASLPNHYMLQSSSLVPSTSDVCNPTSQGAGAGAGAGPRNGTSLVLVHKHGPCSQLARPNPAAPSTATEILARDQSRVDSIQSRLSKTYRQPDQSTSIPANSGLTIGSGNYIVTVGLGTPKKNLSLIFDTGSGLTWTQCLPCKSCYKQKDPIFEPAKSTSYSKLACNSTLCSLIANSTTLSSNCSDPTCAYAMLYGDLSYSVGFSGQDKLSLTPSDVFDGFLFGCGQENEGHFGGTAGLLGLSRDQASFVSQTAAKYGKFFSYCLPSTPSSAGFLKFGNTGVSPATKFTPLLTPGSSFYHLEMNAISVAGKALPIPATVFSSAGIIDSGTVISRIPPAAYDALKAEFRRQMSKYPLTGALSILDTCYDLSKSKDVTLPKISLFFRGGVEVGVNPGGILYANNATQSCLAFAGNRDDDDIIIFGNRQQLTVEVVHDVGQGRIGFRPGGCS
ncbi:aspartyl protease family protein At5g10770-like [Malania oleifera]|uniref:aspartyl protease family protein At5g10770-like n=1 Tax=Malania oleifera TaxID=397392 RepID=UPI0025ADF26F|nr:aspartyl protease family protein At5g10770-like [Malania oleifera]